MQTNQANTGSSGAPSYNAACGKGPYLTLGGCTYAFQQHLALEQKGAARMHMVNTRLFKDPTTWIRPDCSYE